MSTKLLEKQQVSSSSSSSSTTTTTTTQPISLDDSNRNEINMSNHNSNMDSESRDEVDFVRTKTYPPASLIINNAQQKELNSQKCASIMKKLTPHSIYNDCEVKSNLKSSFSTLEKFSLFTLNRKHHHHQLQQQQANTKNNNNNNSIDNINLNAKANGGGSADSTGSIGISPIAAEKTATPSSKHRFVKSASIARLLGHTYNTKKSENELLKLKTNSIKFNSNENTSYDSTNTKNSAKSKDTKGSSKKNHLIHFGNGIASSNAGGGNCVERFQMCSNSEDLNLNTNNPPQNRYNGNSNNSNNITNSNNLNDNCNSTITSASYSNQVINTRSKAKSSSAIANTTNHCKCISSQNQINNRNTNNINKSNSNQANKSHNCNCYINKEANSNSNNNNSNNNSCNNNSNGKKVNIQDFQDDHYNDISTKAFRTISRSLGKLWWKRTHSVEISTPDPEYKVSYLGNVLTGWAKGDGCVEKPLNTLWRNYTQNHKPDVIMRVRVCASGLKATTRQHGLTEYWANRITHCCSPKNYPRVFCWIYRHEGRKLKHELRCHAILCSKESIAQEICNTLRENLDRALHDFKREKILKQNARLSLANSVYENPSLPRRKILLSVGGNNYRPPMERSKSAPKLMAIEEAIGEEEGEEIEQTNEPEMPSCCQKDSLYPAMTLGRRRCRRGHSIRRTGKAYKTSFYDNQTAACENSSECSAGDRNGEKRTSGDDVCEKHANSSGSTDEDDANHETNAKSMTSLGSDDDDLDKLLNHNNYDTSSPLVGELLSYFDMKMHSKTSSLSDLCESLSVANDSSNNSVINGDNLSDDQMLYEASLTTDPSPRPRAAISLENLDNCSDGCEGDCGAHVDFDDEEDELYYRQTAILNLLHRNSMRKLANLSMSSDDSGDSIGKTSHHSGTNLKLQHNMDSDEGSISSGCETASTVTANCEDSSLKYINDDKQHMLIGADELCHNDNSPYSDDKLNDQRKQTLFNDNDITEIKFNNTTVKLKRTNYQNSSRFFEQNANERRELTSTAPTSHSKSRNDDSHHHYSRRNFSTHKHRANGRGGGDVSDSEFSDESGYVEFQDQCTPKPKPHNNHLSSSSTSSSSSVIEVKHQNKNINSK